MTSLVNVTTRVTWVSGCSGRNDSKSVLAPAHIIKPPISFFVHSWVQNALFGAC